MNYTAPGHLPHRAQEIYMDAYMTERKQQKSKRKDEQELAAHAKAWSAVKQEYERDKYGDWVSKK